MSDKLPVSTRDTPDGAGAPGSSAPSGSTKGAKEDLQKAYAEMIAVIKKGIKTLKNQGKPTLDLEVRLAMLDPPRKVPGTKPPLYPR